MALNVVKDLEFGQNCIWSVVFLMFDSTLAH